MGFLIKDDLWGGGWFFRTQTIIKRIKVYLGKVNKIILIPRGLLGRYRDQVFTPSPPISNRVKCHKIFDDLYHFDLSLVCHEFHIFVCKFFVIMKLSVGGASSLMINNSAP